MNDQEDNAQRETPTASDSRSAERRDNVFENIRADEDAFQFIGSTSRRTTSAKDVWAKSGTTNCLGDISDDTLRKISSDRRTIAEADTDQETVTKKFEPHGQGRVLGSGDEKQAKE